MTYLYTKIYTYIYSLSSVLIARSDNTSHIAAHRQANRPTLPSPFPVDAPPPCITYVV